MKPTLFQRELRKRRNLKGLKIRALSRLSGVSASYISMLENGILTRDASYLTLIKLEKILGKFSEKYRRKPICPMCGKRG